MKIFARKFRGFAEIEIDINKVNFLVGDNSSGKSSILHLIAAVSRSDLMDVPRFDEDFGVGEFDYFSPYFGYADVTIGYKTEKDNEFAKVVTVKRRKNGIPEIVRCSYFHDGAHIILRKNKDGTQFAFTKYDGWSTDHLISRHKAKYKFIDFEAEQGISHSAVILEAFDAKEQPKARKVFSASLRHVVCATRLVSPTRALPSKFYASRRKFNVHGTHFAALMMDYSRAIDNEVEEDINAFGLESGLFESISVERVSDRIDDSPLFVTVKKGNKDFFLYQVGVGVSQVVPVLIETMYALNMEGSSVLMQQPELHLHPVAQSALGSYLFKSASRGLRLVIETHSSFLIDRFRADLRDGDKTDDDCLTSESVRILFCQNDESGNTAWPIDIGASGELENDPPEYHQFFVQEMIRTMF